MAENCTHTMHNLYPIRGAQTRDALAWSKYIHEALLYGESRLKQCLQLTTGHDSVIKKYGSSCVYKGMSTGGSMTRP